MLANLCPLEDILLDVQIENRHQLFDYTAQHLHKRFGLDAASIARQLEAREKLGSTGLGLGIALPHARIPGLSSSHMVFIRLQQPIAFDAPDGKPVGKFLLLLVPENAGHDHLQALADAAKMFGHRPFREKLRIASSAQELSLLLRQHAI